MIKTYSNIDRTIYEKYKIIWSANETKLYVDNFLEAINNKNVPETNIYPQFGFRCNWGLNLLVMLVLILMMFLYINSPTLICYSLALIQIANTPSKNVYILCI